MLDVIPFTVLNKFYINSTIFLPNFYNAINQKTILSQILKYDEHYARVDWYRSLLNSKLRRLETMNQIWQSNLKSNDDFGIRLNNESDSKVKIGIRLNDDANFQLKSTIFWFNQPIFVLFQLILTYVWLKCQN